MSSFKSGVVARFNGDDRDCEQARSALNRFAFEEGWDLADRNLNKWLTDFSNWYLCKIAEGEYDCTDMDSEHLEDCHTSTEQCASAMVQYYLNDLESDDYAL